MTVYRNFRPDLPPGPLVPRGTPIAVIAPSHAYDPERLAAGLAIAAEAGHNLHPLPDLLQPHRYFAAPDAHRRAQLVQALTDDRYGAVWIARGGSGLTRLLDAIPAGRVGNKPVLGFSDGVALAAALWRHTPALPVHAPVLHSLPITDVASRDHLFALLDGAPTSPLHGEIWVEGRVEGPLVGGNVCVLAALCGTRHQVDARGAILVLEDVAEAPYRLDRSLQQLAASGVFEHIAGVALGTFVGCEPPADATWSLRDLFLEHLVPLDVPVLAGLPIGHGPENRAFRWGAEGRIDGETLTIGR